LTVLSPALADRIRAEADRIDQAGQGIPTDSLAALREQGALLAPAPARMGGRGLGTEPAGALSLLALLRELAQASLSLGRLFEGHVNAFQLLSRYGTEDQLAEATADARAGHLFGIWVTDGPEPVRLLPSGTGWRLDGVKPFGSGIGAVSRPLITATMPDGSARMVLVRLHEAHRLLPAPHAPTGMRAAANGGCDFSGMAVEDRQLIGAAGDYLRQPWFSAGAWRASAVALGGLERLVTLFCDQLAARGREANPHQRQRIGEALIARETAAMWVRRAALVAESERFEAEDVAETVNLARIAVERAALDAIERVQRGLGLQAFLPPNEVERLLRDLLTFLRQPAPDETLVEAAGWFAARPVPDLAGTP
jgi:alkylation response protein AidB-like acyl-CoA dehydrogenase